MEKEKRATVAILQSHLVGKSHLIMRAHQSFGRLDDIRQQKSANEALQVCMETSTGVQGGQIKVDALANDGQLALAGRFWSSWRVR